MDFSISEAAQQVVATDEVAPDTERHGEALDRPPRVLHVDPEVAVAPLRVHQIEGASLNVRSNGMVPELMLFGSISRTDSAVSPLGSSTMLVPL